MCAMFGTLFDRPLAGMDRRVVGQARPRFRKVRTSLCQSQAPRRRQTSPKLSPSCHAPERGAILALHISACGHSSIFQRREPLTLAAVRAGSARIVVGLLLLLLLLLRARGPACRRGYVHARTATATDNRQPATTATTAATTANTSIPILTAVV
jgi:hypothetical protein